MRIFNFTFAMQGFTVPGVYKSMVSPTQTNQTKFQISPYNDPRTHLIKVKVIARVAVIYTLVYTTNHMLRTLK